MLESMTSTPEPDDRPAAAPEPSAASEPGPAAEDIAGAEDGATAAAGSSSDPAPDDAPNDDVAASASDGVDTPEAGAASEGADASATGAASDGGADASEGADSSRPAAADSVDADEVHTAATGSGAGFGAGFGAPPWTSAGSGSAGSPGGFIPPWSGYRPPPTPPGTGGVASRYGLVRPVHNRYIAGVCGAFARATNTDPVLWRVALPVLTVLGGFGILVYILGWLLIPAEGDSASPVESLFGRGWSSTSKWVTIVLGIIAAAWIVATFSTGIGWKIVVAAAIVGALVVLGGSRGSSGPRWSSRPADPQSGPDRHGFDWYAGAAQAPTGTPAPGAAGSSMAAGGTATAAPGATPAADATAPATPRAASSVATGATSPTGTGWPDAGWHTAAGSLSYADPLVGPSSDPTVAGTATIADDAGWQPPAYRPPFAPGGPYAQSDPYTTAAFPSVYDDPAYPMDFPGLTSGAPANPPPSAPPAQRHRSTVARRITLFAAVLVVGVLGILDATNTMSVPAPAYFAAALATIGLGLVIGSLFGRVRGPIFLGIVLVIGLVVTSLTSAYHGQQVTIRPTSFAQLPTDFQGSVGRVTVDLRKLNFAGQDRTIDLKLSAGEILVELPPNVDAHVMAKVGAGDTLMFGLHSNSGVRAHANVTNNGADGPGGGKITVNANIAFAGLVEVKR
jgi:phage shock protein PspC (stress-responsive transcriptional regulator)